MNWENVCGLETIFQLNTGAAESFEIKIHETIQKYSNQISAD